MKTLSEVEKHMEGKEQERTSWAGVNEEREWEPRAGEADRPQHRREGGLKTTPRQ